jgi:hypothetical protein
MYSFQNIYRFQTHITISQQYLKLIFTISQQYLKLISQYLNNITIFTTFTITSQQFTSIEQIQFNNQIVIHNIDHQFNNQIVNIHKYCFLVHQFNSV